MPRSRVFDMLQSYPFWVFDPGTLGASVMPSVFDPALAFSACTTPEFTAQFYDIKQIVSRHTRKVFRSVEVSPITLSRGVRWWDSDFYIWMTSAIRGERGARKTIFLVHFLTERLFTAGDTTKSTFENSSTVQIQPEGGLAVLSNRVPARAWVLRGCLPGRYKAGSDFDANDSSVSIATLDIYPETIDEVTVATLSQTTARAFSLGVGIADLAGSETVG